MNRFSRGFKILSDFNKRSKENLGTEKEGTKMSHPNKTKPRNIRILNDISKCDTISEGSELSLAIRNLQAECAKRETLLETDDNGNFNIITAEIV
ncbi:hypothetical protein FQA39_LY11416 [Lamprigera yunnana]|nr:hypothetical protein FQA39_LY11416 [Lamprigera yunnana]